jgi:8-hydroxy-5-deazaflavin:NADPH oxidoreductase
MNIGIIGSGKMGSGLGRIWGEKGHETTFSFSRSPDKLEALAGSIRGAKSGTPAEAAKTSDVILLAVGWAAVKGALDLAGPLRGKIVIDCTNPLNADASSLVVGHTTSGAEEVAKLAPGAKVVKAFNTAFAEVYQSDSRLFGSRRATMFYCGDDADAKNVVSKLIIETGFSPIDAGPLKSARYLEGVAMLMIQLGYRQGMGTDIALSLMQR